MTTNEFSNYAQTAMSLGTFLAILYGTFVIKLNAFRQEAAIRRREEIAAEVKSDLQEATRVSNSKLDILHTLANSNMGAEKKKVWDLAEELASTTKDPRHILKAAAAHRAYAEHMEKQALIDNNTPTKFFKEDIQHASAIADAVVTASALAKMQATTAADLVFEQATVAKELIDGTKYVPPTTETRQRD